MELSSSWLAGWRAELGYGYAYATAGNAAAWNVTYLEEDAKIITLFAKFQQRHCPFVHVLRVVYTVWTICNKKHIEKQRREREMDY